MMVGDNLKDDVSSALFLSPSFAPYLLRTFLIHFEVACGKRAGAFTCLLDKTGRYDSPEYTDVEFKPDYKVFSSDPAYNTGDPQLLYKSTY
ncbi:haloacid dehalogenase-like hydrolase domain-containing protein At2g33255 isoform X2 [Camellia sinensis]|uniref:haloacid dehalogenase-like hydrolase domain-containing protein At2g33255 isoform X2 n=1 Tax=Camellia sinensis TaxID=4442 RepID=UPI001036BA1C|nr:haloacid dehalogenase-like hydrolase domain-containing protein At2g33255 isoform X2 [Camellia sinensis]